MREVNELSTATYKRNYGAAFTAMRELLKDAGDTVQVFRIMEALNGDASKKGYHRLISTPEGGRIAYRRVELMDRLTDPDWLAQFAPGTVGAAYRDFLARTGFSAQGLADVSTQDRVKSGEVAHPYAWYGRRMRDMHDVWHVLTGYRAEEPLGELGLVAFSYAQGGGLGWAFIAVSAVLKDIRKKGGRKVARAAWEGYRNGRHAAWLAGEDIEVLFAEDLEAARARLKIRKPVRYEIARQAKAELAAAGAFAAG